MELRILFVYLPPGDDAQNEFRRQILHEIERIQFVRSRDHISYSPELFGRPDPTIEESMVCEGGYTRTVLHIPTHGFALRFQDLVCKRPGIVYELYELAPGRFDRHFPCLHLLSEGPDPLTEAAALSGSPEF